MHDHLFYGSLSELDPELYELTQLEAERQYRRLILIPSESSAPLAVREALGSAFQNLYAEGYPGEAMRWMTEDEILDYPARLAYIRRYSDPRYYQGVEYADIVESLARRRCAETFATEEVSADKLYVNVQALSGAPANNAVYHALINSGDTILGMNLLHGGHLTHGSPVNRSGKLYNAVHYNVDPETEQLDYDAIQALAQEYKPKIIVAGYSSYPWVPDWKKFREIADSVGAYFMADISHIAGMIAAKVIPSPVGYAHVITFTTHKTLTGPRGACIITQSDALSRKIDRAVFPGEQGGPHIHAIAALALTFKLTRTPEFHDLQSQIIKNCKVLTDRLSDRGLRISFGGTNTHLGNIDCRSVTGPDGTPLSGDMAARILEIAGIIANRNTIPGDRTALRAMGVRYGTPWMTQRGLGEKEMIEVGDIMADVLLSTTPYQIKSRNGFALRAKVDFDVLEKAKIRVRELAAAGAIDAPFKSHGYPHFFYLDDHPKSTQKWTALELSSRSVYHAGNYQFAGDNAKSLQPGKSIYHFVYYAFSSDVEALKVGESQRTSLCTPHETIEGVLTYVEPGTYQFSLPTDKAILAATWLRDISDGYVKFDADLTRRLPGPVTIRESDAAPVTEADGEVYKLTKPYFIGRKNSSGKTLPEFKWEEPEHPPLKRTPLYDIHTQLGGRIIPFAGWELPVWYTSVVEEHLATRQAAGLFDIAHMGVYQCEGPEAAAFLDCVCANDIDALGIGESCYTHLLDPHANVIDDLMVYRRDQNVFLMVVNASNDDKDWAWLNAVHAGKVMVDAEHPGVRVFGRNAVLRNLRDKKEGADMRVGIALQGRRSRDILLSLGCSDEDLASIKRLTRTRLCDATVGGFDLIVSRTGYTGEKMSFELFVHPDQAAALWKALLKAGEPLGLKPCGLGARDSLRTEAGLPLYGHEMSGELGLGVSEAGFGYYVKVYKPWFIGREAFLERQNDQKAEVIRFRFEEKGVRMAHLGDPVLDKKGRTTGVVTSCAIDSEGFLTGQAYLETKYTEEGTPIFIFQSAPRKAAKAPAELSIGDRITLPDAALVIPRYPKLG